MKYISTRGNIEKLNASEAIKLGMVPLGGLFVPESIPSLSLDDISKMKDMSYEEIAENILKLYLNDFTEEEIKTCVKNAYNDNSFSKEERTPLVSLNEKTAIMELWHGPTAAFKDMALQIMPHLLINSKKINKADKETVILVATSGDTGKAALEGFKNVDGIKIIVFYPVDGVSHVQKLQMDTTDGNNTYVFSLIGNFDDCQTGVKEIFSNKELEKELNDKGFEFSSANSINWGRLLPQIIYYFKAYAILMREGKINAGDKINFSVPTGNFGNILAGYYAKEMGLPVNKLVCASNKNNVLSDFFKTGNYNRNREFHKTMSPSMDILISSNLERFIFEISGHNADELNKYYNDLNSKGEFTINEKIKAKLDEIILADFTNEEDTLKTIKKCFDENSYLIDTHTAVALNVAEKFNLEGITIVDSTASPYKFSQSVLDAFSETANDEFEAVEKLSKMSKTEIHRAVAGLEDKKVIHNTVIEKTQMEEVIKKVLKI